MHLQWSLPNVPHKGWDLERYYDSYDGDPETGEQHDTCMMCGKHPIRWIHVVTHKEHEEEMHVGCDCAGKMTGQAAKAAENEKLLKSRVGKRKRLLDKYWPKSAKGNRWTKYEGHILTIRQDVKSGKYYGAIDDNFGRRIPFDTLDAAKNAVISGVFALQDQGRWAPKATSKEEGEL